MRGKHRIVIQNKKMKYDFEIRRNITVIRGDSATGKTALVDMIREYYENGADSGIELQCDKSCAVLEGRNWELQLGTIHDSLIFIDEGNSFVISKDFASAIQKTDNYYVIVTRESLETLPYSVEEIYGIRNSGKYGTLRQTYNEFFRIYGNVDLQSSVRPKLIIVEDSGSGFQFFQDICDRQQLQCVTAGGKSNVFRMLMEQQDENILVIADGAAFGSEMEKMMQFLKMHGNAAIYLPESFEWMILSSGVIKDGELKEILTEPEKYIESGIHFSWERFFTWILINKTEGTYLKYVKKELNPAYTQDAVAKAILNVMQKIEWNGQQN